MGMSVSVTMDLGQLLALPDDGLRHELLDGLHVVSPSPSLAHQRAVGMFYEALRALIRRGDLDGNRAEVLLSPADLRLGPRTLVQPDIFVLPVSSGERLERWADAAVPLLVVEVLSPSTAAHDHATKRSIYLEAGVEEYWIVDIDARGVHRWRTGDLRPEFINSELRFTLTASGSGTISLPELFAVITGRST